LIRDQLTILQIELPTEVSKKELRQQLADLDHVLILDDRFRSFVWEIKHMRSGSMRNQVIEPFWKRVYDGYHAEDMDGLQVRSFVLNDFLRASDEMIELSALPPRRVDTSSWGHPWNHMERRRSVGTGLGGPAPGLVSDNVLN
jgi:hypothetical protein